MTHYSPIRPPFADARVPRHFDDGRFHRWRLEHRIILHRTDEAMVCALRFTPPEAELLQWQAGAMAEIRVSPAPSRGRQRDLRAISLPIAGGILVAPHVAAALLPSGVDWGGPSHPTARLPIASIAADGALDLVLIHRPAHECPKLGTVTRHLLGGGHADIRIADMVPPPALDPAITIACDLDGLSTLRAVLRDRASRALPPPTVATTVDPMLLDRVLRADAPRCRVARIRATDLHSTCIDLAHHLAARLDDGTPILIAGGATGLITHVETLLRARFGDTAFDALIAERRWRRYRADAQAVTG